MDETTAASLSQLRLAFKALSKSVEKALMTGMYTGAGGVSVKNYLALHARAVEQLPDDYYVREVLSLDLPEDAPEKQKLAAVSLQAGQMVDYLDGLLKADVRAAYSGPDLDELKTLGRDLQEQILAVTRTTLKRALSGIDISISKGPVPPEPPEPPMPPEPPAPPEPSKAKRKIEIEDDEYETDDDLDGMI